MTNPSKAGFMIFMIVAILACNEQSPKKPAPSAMPSVEAAPPPVKVAETPKLAPSDVVLDPLVKSLKCDKKAKSESCRILTEFADGKRWSAQTPAGEGRWVGQAFVREKGAEKKQLMLLWAKQVPTSQVGPSDLPIRVGTGTLPDDLVEHGFKMVAALSRGDQPSKRNQARTQIESFVPTSHRGAVNTAGSSVLLIAEESVYLRQSGRKVVMIVPNLAQSASPGDGTYAEFWRATW